MGIKNFLKLVNAYEANDKTIDANVVLFDMNCIIYTVLNSYFNSSKKTDKFNSDNVSYFINPNRENDMFEFNTTIAEAVHEHINKIIAEKKSVTHIILCFDGVPAPMKLIEQRRRRFNSINIIVSAENNNVLFNSATFVPDSFQASDLCEKISKLFNEKSSPNLNVIISNNYVPGEGEYKIFVYMKQFVQKLPNSQSLIFNIYSNDNDVNLLSLMFLSSCYENNRKNIDIYTMGINTYKISDMYEEIISLFKDLGNTPNEERIMSFVYFVCLCGNDFIPSIHNIHIKTFIKACIKTYRKVGMKFYNSENIFNNGSFANINLKYGIISQFFERLPEEASTHNTYSTTFESRCSITDHNFIKSNVNRNTNINVPGNYVCCQAAFQYLVTLKAVIDIYLNLTTIIPDKGYNTLPFYIPWTFYDYGKFAPDILWFALVSKTIADSNPKIIEYFNKNPTYLLYRVPDELCIYSPTHTCYYHPISSRIQNIFVFPQTYTAHLQVSNSIDECLCYNMAGPNVNDFSNIISFLQNEPWVYEYLKLQPCLKNYNTSKIGILLGIAYLYFHDEYIYDDLSNIKIGNGSRGKRFIPENDII